MTTGVLPPGMSHFTSSASDCQAAGGGREATSRQPLGNRSLMMNPSLFDFVLLTLICTGIIWAGAAKWGSFLTAAVWLDGHPKIRIMTKAMAKAPMRRRAAPFHLFPSG